MNKTGMAQTNIRPDHSPTVTLSAWLAREFRPVDFLPSIPTALICFFLKVIFSISFAALIFRGPLESYLATGIGMMLYTAFCVGMVMTLTSSIPGVIGIPSDRTAPILAVLTASLLAALPVGASAEVQLQTCMAGLFWSALLTGLFLALLGRYKLGRLIRFLPYPVVGGFMAGAGLLLTKGAFTVLCGFEVTWSSLPRLLTQEQWLHWIPAAFIAISLVLILRRYTHYLIIPGFIFGSILLFYGLAAWSGLSMAELSAKGLLPGPFLNDLNWSPLPFHLVEKADWFTVFRSIEGLATVLLVSSISVLMISSALELSSGKDIDGDRELQSAGLANLVSVLGGGIVGLHSLSLSSLVVKLGPQSRWVGLMAALGAGGMLWAGPALVNYLPLPVIGGLLLFLGLNFLADWLVDAFKKIPRSDYIMIWVILIVIGIAGYIVGVGVGLVLAVGLFALRYSRVEVVRQALKGDQHRSNVDRPEAARRMLKEKRSSIHVLSLQGYLFFGTAYSLLEIIKTRLADRSESALRYLVIDFRHVSGIDSSALICFVKLQQMAGKNKFYVLLSSMGEEITTSMLRNPQIKRNKGLLFVILPDLDHSIEWCENQLLSDYYAQGDTVTPLQSLLAEAFKNKPGLADRVKNYFSLKKVAMGEVLAEQNDNSDCLFFIESGQVSARLKTNKGETLRLRTMSSGAVVGETGLYLNIPRTASLIADQDSIIHELSLEALRQLEREDTEAACAFHEFLARTLAERLMQTNKMLEAAMR